MNYTTEQWKTALEKATALIESKYNLPVDFIPLADGNTGDFDGSRLKVDNSLSPEISLFVLLHIFGHNVQWCISDELRKLGQETVDHATDEQIKQIYIYEKEASQYGLKMLHEAGVIDLDQWVSDYWTADWRWLSHFYKTGEKLDQRDVKDWIKPGEVEPLPTLPIPEFTPKVFDSRWAF